jgi:hypothetical protein
MVGQDTPQAPLKVLFIGNSYTSVNDLPAMVNRRDLDRLAAGTWERNHRAAGPCRLARRPAKALDATGTRRDHPRRQDLERQDRHGDRAGNVPHGGQNRLDADGRQDRHAGTWGNRQEADRRRVARRQDSATLLEPYRPCRLARRTDAGRANTLDLPPLWRVHRVSTD